MKDEAQHASAQRDPDETVQSSSAAAASAVSQRPVDDGLPMPQRLVAIGAISFGIALLVIDGSIANVALPTISRKLGVSEGAVTNVVTVYQLVMVMGLLPFAKLGDRIGHRTVYQIGQVVFCLASALCFFVENFAALLMLRAVQAVGAGLALSVSVAMLRRIYPAKSLGSGLGLNSVVVATAAAIAPTLGGFIVADYDWRLVFVVAAPLALVSLLLGRALPAPEPQGGKADWLGGGWSAATVALLIGGVQVAAHAGSVLPGVALFVAGIVSAFFLVHREREQDRPIVPVDLMAQPVIGLSVLAAVLVFCASGAVILALPFLFEQSMGYAPDEVGLLLLPYPLTLLIVSPVAGWLSDRVAPTKLGVTGMAIAILGLLLMAFMPAQPGVFGISWRLTIVALGFGLFFAPNSRLLIANAPQDRTAAAGGLISTARLFGQTTAAALVGLLLSLGLGLGPTPMFLAAGLALVAALCSMVRFRTVRAQTVPAEAREAGV
ncbi:MFS transporter [Croceicoccus sp. F390]|uniref:MFS transporter n=1 Tax=Croceicoccus esteveae TaxID=3075597 RepID=A0ABU2ZFB1_9SPHN|nr:MFS transporter [Croceicoccus sp. F390]MDT0575278.1 MFS transporter [Croceicoccus sp. F390]